MLDGSGASVGETGEADDAVEVEAVVPDVEVEAEDAFLMSMVKSGSPVYDCTVPSPDFVVVMSSLEMVKVPVSRSLTEFTVNINPSSSDLATETVYVPHRVSLTAGSSPFSLVPITSQPCLNSGLLLVTMLIP